MIEIVCLPLMFILNSHELGYVSTLQQNSLTEIERVQIIIISLHSCNDAIRMNERERE